jgi:hypothetical protein
MRTGLGFAAGARSAVYCFSAAKKLEWPVIKKVDRFTRMAEIGGSYYEESKGRSKTIG